MISTFSEKYGNLSFDVAIYGAGPAGISLATRLAESGLSVGLFEAGTYSPPKIDEEHPYYAENAGRPYDLLGTRLRYLGGTSNHWGGWCRPLDPYDFEDRPYIPLSGWPIQRQDLDPFYEEAIEVCDIATGGLGLRGFDHDFGYEGFLHEKSPDLAVKNFLFSPPTRFGKKYKSDLQESENLHCFLDATLVRLVKEGRGVGLAQIRSREGAEGQVSAVTHVLAMGAVENARMLLHSGVGNSSGYAGRCFSDHLGKTVAQVIGSRDSRYFMDAYTRQGQEFQVLPHLTFTDEILRDLELVNFGMIMNPASPDGRLDRELIRQAGFLGAARFRKSSMLVRMENIPNPESRLSLINDTDGYGVPRLRLNWRPHPLDTQSIDRIINYLPKEIGVRGGRVKIMLQDLSSFSKSATYQAHHMGTTRMSANPQEGIVNKDLRCHDLDNLFIAGSSVFPTFGFANPTLTIVALSLRLAAYLDDKYQVKFNAAD